MHAAGHQQSVERGRRRQRIGLLQNCRLSGVLGLGLTIIGEREQCNNRKIDVEDNRLKTTIVFNTNTITERIRQTIASSDIGAVISITFYQNMFNKFRELSKLENVLPTATGDLVWPLSDSFARARKARYMF